MTSAQIHPVSLIGGGPGAWDLITVRGMRALQEAEVILTDHLGPAPQLDKLCDISAKELIDVSKLPYKKSITQDKINELLIEHAQAGRKVARLKGGDPFVFGRGFEEVQALTKASIPTTVIPGVTSAVSVPAGIGIPVTQRGMVHGFTVVSGHLPPGHKKSLVDWHALAQSGATLSIIMGVKNAPAIARALQEGGLAGSTPCAIIQEGTLDTQREFRCNLEHLAQTMEDNNVSSPAVYVIGEVAGLDPAGD